MIVTIGMLIGAAGFYYAAPAALAGYATTLLTLATAWFCLRVLDQLLGIQAWERTLALCAGFLSQERSGRISVRSLIDTYNELYKNKDAQAAAERKSKYAAMVDAYYNIVTLFYEWGWGASFHFAYALRGESFIASIRRHEHYLASRLNVGPKAKVLDVGCGIGGPLINIAHFTKFDITGITINEHQVGRATEIIASEGLSDKARVVQGDFLHLDKKFKANTFDAVYAIEATCHAPRREDVFSQVFKVLKPGGRFASYEWVMTDNYEPGNPQHEETKHLIELGDALPSLISIQECVQALKTAGFEVEEVRDMVEDHGQAKPWYWPLEPSWNPLLFRFQFNPFGKAVTRIMLNFMEAIKLAPVGSSKVQAMLQQAQVGLVDGGRTKIFTPMLLVVARKPL